MILIRSIPMSKIKKLTKNSIMHCIPHFVNQATKEVYGSFIELESNINLEDSAFLYENLDKFIEDPNDFNEQLSKITLTDEEKQACDYIISEYGGKSSDGVSQDEIKRALSKMDNN